MTVLAGSSTIRYVRYPSLFFLVLVLMKAFCDISMGYKSNVISLSDNNYCRIPSWVDQYIINLILSERYYALLNEIYIDSLHKIQSNINYLTGSSLVVLFTKNFSSVILSLIAPIIITYQFRGM